MTGKIGIFGGTFNPPHIGHMGAAQAAMEALGLRIIFIPSNIPPHKDLPRGTPPALDRLKMMKIAARCIPGAEVSDIEILRGKNSYTADTVREFRAKYPGAQLYLIVGTDMFTSLPSWRNPEYIFANCRIAVVSRGADDRAVIRASSAGFARDYNAVIHVVDNDPIPVSSTQIREGLYSGMEKWLPDGVFEYIKERGLYRGA